MSILDLAIRKHQGLAGMVSGAAVFEVPVQLYPWDGTGASWTDIEGQDNLVPRVKGERGAINGEWCRLPYRKTILLNRDEASFTLLNEFLVADAPPDSDMGRAARAFHAHAYAVGPGGATLCVLADRFYVMKDSNRAAGTAINLKAAAADAHEILAGPSEARANALLGWGGAGGTHLDLENAHLDHVNWSLAIWAALALINCKNISHEVHQPSRQARRNSGHLPLFTYHRLVIRRSVSAREGGRGNGEPMAKHWIRGHFKEYSGNGLFGSVRGIFWWSPHLHGRAKRVVAKDYVVSGDVS